MGLLFAGALFGLSLTAWPVYLHLFRRQRPEVQVVPSLLLFDELFRHQRRRELKDIVLLLARVLALVALFFLVGQLVIESASPLPLPRVDACRRVLGVVLDDSLTSLAVTEGRTRFEDQRDWLLGQIRELPPTTVVCFATTATGVAGPVLSKAEATAFLRSLTPALTAGHAPSALAALCSALDGYEALLCYAGALTAESWAPDPELPALGVELQVFDSEIPQPQVYLRGLRPESEAPGCRDWVCRIEGAPGSLTNLRVTIENRAIANPQAIPLTIADGLRGWTRLTLPASDVPVYRIVLSPGTGHPFETWFVRQGSGPRTGLAPGVRVLYERTPASVVARRVFGAAFRAVQPRVPLRYWQVDGEAESEDAGALPQTLVLLALSELPPSRQQALADALAAGVRVVVVPPPDGPAATAPFLPGWDAPLDIPVSRPLRCEHNPASRDLVDLDRLLLSGLSELELTVCRPPHPGASDRWLWRTRDGVSVITGQRTDAGGLVLAVGVPLVLAPDSPVLHPVFPHLLGALVAPANGADGAAAEPWVGDRRSLAELFGDTSADADTVLFPPDGSQRRVTATLAATRLCLDQPGLYRLTAQETDRWAAVNIRRPAAIEAVSLDQLRRAWPGVKLIRVGRNESLAARHYRTIIGRGTEAQPCRYDLTPVCAAVLLLALAIEGGIYVLTLGKGATADA